MSLDLLKLEKVVELSDGAKRARCPACAETGKDTKGEHLRIYPDGRFGCCVSPKDGEHRRRIFALASRRGRRDIQVKNEKPRACNQVRRNILSLLEGQFHPVPSVDLGVGAAEIEAKTPVSTIIRTPRTPQYSLVDKEKCNEINTPAICPLEFEKGVRGVRPTTQQPSGASRLVTDREDLAGIAESLQTSNYPVCLDIETYGERRNDALDPFKGDIRLLTLAIPSINPWLIDLRATGYDLGPIKPALERVLLVGHNLKFDLLWLHLKCGLRAQRLFCTCTASRLLSNGTDLKNDLGECLRRHLQVDLSKDQAKSDWGGTALTPEQIAYAANDVSHLHALQAKLELELAANGLTDVAALEMKLLPVVVDMEAHGMGVDREKLSDIHDRATAEAQAIKTKMCQDLADPDFNPNSPHQILEKLRQRGEQAASTGKDILATIKDTLAGQVLEYRDAQKRAEQAKQYLDAVDLDGRIHASFNPLGTDTGRFSSSNPNLQNVGRGELRACFVPPPGHVLVIADYSQIELRIAAAIADEWKMIEAYKNGADLHRQTASLVKGKPVDQVTSNDRQLAKAVNFGLIYGQSPKGLVLYARSTYGVAMSFNEAETFRARFFSGYGNLQRWHQLNWRKAENCTPEVRTVTGRRRLLPTAPDKKWPRFTGLVNTPVQGSAADGMKLAMIELAKCLPAEAHMVSTVHDELIVETPTELAEQVKELVRSCMIEAMSKLFPQVPIEVEAKIANTWGEK